ncbi:lipase family alpha/beta hydrolase [Streptomyces sp. NPDC002187]|uniref:lipase family alpha/beta hydrolase n=1 Tax=Streptomyces sp. NPDC002187 TaxID=3364637 RepID=UPI00368058A4
MTPQHHPDDITSRYLTGDTHTRMTLVRDPQAATALRALLGARAYTELVELAGPPPQHHLGDTEATNLIFVPGVMGSILASTGLGGIWWLDIKSRNRIDSLALSADGLSDAHPSFKVSPVTVDSLYEGFLFPAARRPDTQPLAFPYDWRKPLHTSADHFRQTVLDCRATAHPRVPINVVAHSMGGLVVRTALMRHPDLWQHIGKIVFLGTPHYGSPAIGGYLKNHLWGFELLALLGRYLSRDTFRTLHGVISLLPAPAGIYPESSDESSTQTPYDHPCGNFDFYDAGAWRLNLAPAQELHLQSVLDAAARQHRDLHIWHQSLDQVVRDRMAVIAGTGFKTLFRLAYNKRMGFLWQHMDRITTRIPHHPDRDGDGRVPLASARLPWTAETRYINGEHGSLPNLPDVQQDVWRFLKDQPMQLSTSPKAAMGEHLAPTSHSTSALALPQLPTQRASDDPGYLNITGPTAANIAELEKRLDTGDLQDFIRTRLL